MTYFNFNRTLPRRTFLRGAGAALALPVLDAMLPAFASAGSRVDAVRRFSIVYTPNGKDMARWIPETTGDSFRLSPILEPLAPYQDQLLVISGLDNNEGDARPGQGETAPHERAGGVFLTGVHPLREGRTGISIDQVIARELGSRTQLASLELGLHDRDMLGNCEKGWSCAYQSTLSWRTPTTPMPVEHRPREVFERLFGDAGNTDPDARLSRIQARKSILDSVTEAASRMMRDIGADDRSRLTEYLDGLRETERRIQLAEQQTSRDLPTVDRPSAGTPAAFADHLKIMFDLQVLAFQTDMTRMISFMMGPGQSHRTFGEIGIPDVHHALSHHRGDMTKLEKIFRIDLYHTELLTYYLEKLRSTRDIDGSLLDNMIIMFGSDMSNGNDHVLQDLPIVLIGGGTGRLKGGRHIRYAPDTPVANLYLGIADKLDVHLGTFGDSTGVLDLA